MSAPTADTADVVGVLRRHPRGFGFIDTAGESVFVPANRAQGLLDGDTIAVFTTPDRVKPGSFTATAAALVTRARTHAVGDLTPDGQFRVDPGVGDLVLPLRPGRQDLQAGPGSCVVASITDGVAVIQEVLGDPLSEQALARRILDRVTIPHTYPEAPNSDPLQPFPAGTVSTWDPWRRDARQQHVITIDADHSQDLDDALHAVMGADGAIRVWVHIADVAAHVPPGSHADLASREVPTSVYLPQMTRHMLPADLGTEALSLIPGVDRDVLTVEMRIDVDGVVRSVDVYSSIIQSRERLSYATAASYLTGAGTTASADMVRVLWAAACRLGITRAARGGTDAWHSDAGTVSDYPEAEAPAHLLIERLMVAANEAVATWLADRGMPVLARVHPAPSPESIADFAQALNDMGVPASESMALTPRALAALAAAAAEGGRGALFWSAALSAFERAQYSTSPAGHFGLGSPLYLHFTSPLRRRADLLVHRVIRAYLSGERDVDLGELAQEAQVINEVNARAAAAERQARRAAVIATLRPRQIVQATVIAGRPGKPPRALYDGTDVVAVLHCDKVTVSPGDRVDVRVKSADPVTDTLEFRLIGKAESKSRRRRSS